MGDLYALITHNNWLCSVENAYTYLHLNSWRRDQPTCTSYYCVPQTRYFNPSN